MNHKEKAKELVDKILSELSPQQTWEDNAKDCAIIAVDEIIKELNDIEKTDRGCINDCYGQSDWKKVKQEITKL